MVMTALSSKLANEKKSVSDRMTIPLLEKQIWHLISFEWFVMWKAYVDFDGIKDISDEERESLHPGPINNSKLKGENDNQLKPDLVEGRDYVFLPSVTADLLFNRYQGGPKFLRNVINMGSSDNPLYQIEVYLVDVLVYDCNKAHVDVLPEDKPRYLNVSKKLELANFMNDYKMNILRKYMGGVRCWVRVGDSESSAPVPESHASEGGLVGRKLTADVTDRVGTWLYVRDTKGLTVAELRGDKPRLELLIEFCESSFYSSIDQSPRGRLLNAWKATLRPGDVIDAQDRRGEWCESVVTAVADSYISVHFKGWSKEFDEKIAVVDPCLMGKVQPLHSKTRDWRSALQEDSLVDLNIADLPCEKSYWVTGKVVELDLAGGRVLVQYDKAFEETRREDREREKRVLSDDDMKKIVLTSRAEAEVAVAVPMDLEDAVGTTAVVVNNAANDNFLSRWVDLNSESLCAAQTHTKKSSALAYKGLGTHSSSYAVTGTGSGGHTTRGTVRERAGSAEDEFGEKNTPGKPMARGAVGLQNLGNTCFMNSVLQCLSNTQVLTDYFLENKFKDEINSENVLGHGGKVAMAYAKLLKDLWSDAYTKVVPRAFKRTIGEFQPQFAGYQQQDSQELMGFLLDGLHEDLNRCKKKPAVNKVESGGRPDDLIARESWRRFLLRNDSHLVDRVYGQFRSHVTCRCGKESVTFDAFNTLSLPVPVSTAKTLTVLFRPLPAGSAPVRVLVEAEPTDSIGDVQSKVLARLVKAGLYHSSVVTSVGAASVGAGGAPLSMMETEAEDYVHIQSAGTEGESAEESADVITDRSAYEERLNAIRRKVVFPPVLHAAAMWSHSQGKVSKNLQLDALASDFTSGRETLLLFELEHPCPLKPSPSYGAAAPARPTAEVYVSYADLYVGKVKPSVSGSLAYAQIDVYGTPFRFNVTQETTQRQLHDIVYSHTKRYVKKDSPFYEDPARRPFELYVTNMFANGIKAKLEPTNDAPVVLAPDQVLLAAWREEADNSAHFNKTEFDRLDEAKEAEDSGEEGTLLRRGKAKLTIYSCLDKFCEREQLNEAETLYCSQCRQHVAPVKKLDLWAVPDVLIVQLKRFQYIPGQYFVHREKINELVDFPLVGLDLSAYVKGPQLPEAPPLYDLYAVSLHAGGLGGGHYTAACQNPLNGKWYHFNDSHVAETSPESAVCEQSYVLFYKRSRGALRWAGLKPLEPPGLPDEAT